MVSAAKLRRAQSSLLAARPYANKVKEVMAHMVACSEDYSHPFMEERPVKKVCYVVLSPDRGLSGSYNGQLFRMMENVLKNETRPTYLMVLGSRGCDYLKRRKYNVDKGYANIGDNPSYSQSLTLSEYIAEGYLAEEYDEVHVIYAEFLSAMSQRPVCVKLLPIVPEKASCEAKEADGYIANYILEPGAKAILDNMLPNYLQSTVYRMMLEAKAGEHGARMTAMSMATDNANEMIDKLTLSLNRARQAAITTEISEIVGGAAALQ